MVTISPGSLIVSYYSTGTLTCEVHSLTTPNITWTSNTDVTLTSTSLVSNEDMYTSILTLKQVTLEYIGEYTCIAVNEGGEISDMISVDVYGKNISLSICMYVHLLVSVSFIDNPFSCSLSLSLVPLPVVTISPRSVNVSYNSTVTLTCEVQSLTIPNVTWMSNTDVTLASTSLVSSEDMHTSILTLNQVTLENIGKYTCTAVNEGGERSDVINVDVYGKNMCDIVCVCICLFVCLSVYLPIVLSVSLSFCLFADVFILLFGLLHFFLSSCFSFLSSIHFSLTSFYSSFD